MWLYLIGVVLVLLGIVGAFAGGIYTLILIPIGLIMLASAAGYTVLGGGAERKGGRGSRGHAPVAEPLPHSAPAQSAHHLGTPEELVDARRAQQ
jgi:hypothetical protein